MNKGRQGEASPHTIRTLWGKAAGRCEYEGCNKLLYQDDVTSENINRAFVAHIVAASPGGERGDKELSALLFDDINNLMLLCHEHHRLIDQEKAKDHGVDRLRAMKKKHEDRIKTLTEIDFSRKSIPITYGANIGNQRVVISKKELAEAMVPDNYPSGTLVNLEHRDSSIYDSKPIYWEMEAEHLNPKFLESIRPLLGKEDVESFSVFALAPQPLLVKLGSKLSDLHKVKVYQKHREPDTWKWQEISEPNPMRIIKPQDTSKTPVLIFSICAKAISTRVRSRFGDNASIWEVTAEDPNNDILRSADQLVEFRKLTRRVLDAINASSSADFIKVFMALPAACAVELGRVWMPKADKALVLFDKNNAVDMDDTETITIK